MGLLKALKATRPLFAFPQLILPFFVIASATSAAHAQATPQINLVTESYPPYTYRENGDYKGASVDQIKLIMKAANIPYKMEIMPWARAMALAIKQPDTCIFAKVHNAERHAKFKWVEPLSKSRTILIRKKGSPVAPKSLDEAKAFLIGTQRDDFTQGIFESNGFPRIDLATDLGLTMKKLMSGRIDLMPISEKYYEKLKAEGEPIDAVLLLAESIYALGCNKAVPDSTISSMQTALDGLIASGMQDKIYAQYGVSEK